MSRKDYIQLARIIKDNSYELDHQLTSGKKWIKKNSFINDLCDVLKQDNRNFNRLRFIDACNDR